MRLLEMTLDMDLELPYVWGVKLAHFASTSVGVRFTSNPDFDPLDITFTAIKLRGCIIISA